MPSLRSILYTDQPVVPTTIGIRVGYRIALPRGLVRDGSAVINVSVDADLFTALTQVEHQVATGGITGLSGGSDKIVPGSAYVLSYQPGGYDTGINLVLPT